MPDEEWIKTLADGSRVLLPQECSKPASEHRPAPLIAATQEASRQPLA